MIDGGMRDDRSTPTTDVGAGGTMAGGKRQGPLRHQQTCVASRGLGSDKLGVTTGGGRTARERVSRLQRTKMADKGRTRWTVCEPDGLGCRGGLQRALPSLHADEERDCAQTSQRERRRFRHSGEQHWAQFESICQVKIMGHL